MTTLSHDHTHTLTRPHDHTLTQPHSHTHTTTLSHSHTLTLSHNHILSLTGQDTDLKHASGPRHSFTNMKSTSDPSTHTQSYLT